MPDVMINGPAGRIEARYYHAKHPGSPVVLLLHPHPMQGGNMNSRVIVTMAQAFARQGCSVLRFNFRGVGRSQGRFSRGEGELADAAAALDWLRALNPNPRRSWIGGYSFGAWICMQLLMRRPGMDGFVIVAPPVNLYDFGFLAPCPSSGLIIQGGLDEVVPEPAVARLVKKLSGQRQIRIDYRLIDGGDHYLDEHMAPLAAHLRDYLDAVLGAPAAAD